MYKDIMYLLSTQEMKEAEETAIYEKGIPSLILMENAARGAVDVIIDKKPKNVIVFSGKGNNGGDGLAIARLLMTHGIKTKIIFIGDKNSATPDCKTNLEILQNYNGDIEYTTESININDYDIVVDALIGTGLTKKLSDKYIDIVNIINKGKFIVSVDCPTGVNCNTGNDYGIAVNAHITVTFHMAKTGLLLYPAYLHTGKLVVKHIGAPYITKSSVFVIKNGRSLLPQRKPYSNKGTYGKALFVSGCDTMAGAAVINGTSAYMAGCGLVNICSTPHVMEVIHNSLPEAVTSHVKSIDINYGNVIAIGSGIGISPESKSITDYVLNNSKVPVVADADALNIISQNEPLKYKTSVITPHIKEMSRLTGLDTAYIRENIIDTAKNYAKKYNTVVVLKDAHSIIASPDGKICINITGTSAMSKGGSGDSLTGVITGLIAQGTDCFTAACLGCYLNGKAGEIAENEKSSYSLLALDISKAIPKAINSLQ
ncbi:MAG: NAD(P)H-hydrate dehydratase [Clostridia bacterium]|nr:NAD(P)H-hydrate dehydratase [Clostridia bacterium]